MLHFLFLLLFAAVTAAAFAVFAAGSTAVKIRHALKVFAEFVGVSLLIAWICYFLPG